MVNQAWGYWTEIYKKTSPKLFFYKIMNFSAYFFEILGGVLMLIPDFRWVGGGIIALSFLFVKTQIRLGVLCDKLILITVLYTSAGGWLHQLLTSAWKLSPPGHTREL